jgi:microcystin-dependent protein
MSSEPFIGQIKILAFNFAPRLHATCNGQILSIAQNSALFSLLGTTYGGNGQTTFALPNLQSRAPIHAGSGPGLPNYTLGEFGGEENHTLIITELPMHNHLAVASSNTADQTYPNGNTWADDNSAPSYSTTSNGAMNPASVSITGSTQPHPNMSPYLVVNYCIALQGIFPSRN